MKVSCGARSGAGEDTLVPWELQAERGARISENGEGMDGTREGNHAGEAYRSRERMGASLSSVNRGEVREKEGVRGVLCPGMTAKTTV